MSRHLFSLLVLFVAAVIFGCGGGGGGSTDGGGSTSGGSGVPVTFAVNWAMRSRAIPGPASALSAVLTLPKASPDGTDFTYTVNRNESPGAYTASYISSNGVLPGTYPMTFQFYSGANGGGAVVAAANASVTIESNGTGIGEVTVLRKIAQVAVDTNQSIPFVSPSQLTFTARSSSGQVVALSPGSAFWTLVSGQSVIELSPSGVATPLSSGLATVKVTVDGLTSQGEIINVSSSTAPDFRNSGFETPTIEVDGWKANGDVIGSFWTGNANWGIANGLGDWGQSAHTGQQYAFVEAATGGGFSQGSLEQSLSGFAIGKNYRLRLWIARRNGTTGSHAGAPISVFANGTAILEDATPDSGGGWTQFVTKSFTATQATYSFKILPKLPTSAGSTATLVDDVHLEAAP